MKLIKIIVSILILLLLSLVGMWYYVTNKVAIELNEKYAGKEFTIDAMDKTSYFITFDKVVPSGFPHKISWKAIGWKEESKSATIIYNSPLEFGYDLLSQRVFVNYNGEIVASYKPAKHGFGSRLAIESYNILIDLPLSIELFKSRKDPLQLINYISDIKISTGKVEIFDLVDNEKFYDKEFEHAKLSFERTKTYENIDDLLSNIPQKYKIDYVVKTNPINARKRRLPVSLFYGFSSLPANVDLALEVEVKTKSKTFAEFMKEVEIKANIACKANYIDLPDVKLFYTSKNYRNEFVLDTSFKIKTEVGLFNHLFETYNIYAPTLLKSPMGRIVDKEVHYIIQNKEAFKFKDLENSSYDFNLKMHSSTTKNNKHLNIEDFSILSDKSGIRLRNEMQYSYGLKPDWFVNGTLYLTNAPTVIEFSSEYIYRFGKFKFLNNEARQFYIDVNKAFLKEISDHPGSSSNDLSFEYNIESKHRDQAKIGNVKVDQLVQLYSLKLYQKLFEKVGIGGDVLARMREILPQIDGNEPLLQKILPRISHGQLKKDDIGKYIEKQIDKSVPASTKDATEDLIEKFISNP